MDATAFSRTQGFFALALVIVGNAAGNILLKLGASAAQHRPALAGMVNWQTLSGIACFALGIFAYAWALKFLDLHIAQVVVSLQYVAVIVLAALMLHEQISANQWLGIAFIAIGLFICTR